MEIDISSTIILRRLKDRHYIKHAKHAYPTGGPAFWMGWAKSKIDSYNKKTNGNFLIIVIDSLIPNNYYAIPYSVVKPYLFEKDLDNQNRWIFSIRYGELCLHGTDTKIPVTKYHNNFPSNEDIR